MTSTSSSDSLELVTRAAAGNLAAREELVTRLQPRMRTVALAVLGNLPDAEDAVQASLIEVLASAASCRGENLLAWSDRIAVRTSMRLARQRRVRSAHYEQRADLEDVGGRVADSFPDHELPRPIIEYLSALPEARRIALVLRHVMDYSIEEIAELTSASPNTVKDRLLHARAHMRKLIRRDLVLGGVKGVTS